MITYIYTILAIVLIIVGFVEIYRFFTLLILRNKNEESTVIIIPIKGHNEEAELILRSAAVRVKWTDDSKDKGIVCLDCGMDKETRKVCENIADYYSFMEIRDVKELQNYNEHNLEVNKIKNFSLN